MEKLTAIEALDLVAERAQQCREDGESDMRNILYFICALKTLVAEGKTRQEISAWWNDEED